MEPNTGFVYKMLANPRSDGPDTRFFLQAYTRTENGALSPGDALYIGTAEKCRELLDRLISGELTQEQVRNSYIHGKRADGPLLPHQRGGGKAGQGYE